MWKSVALSNLAVTFSRSECEDALQQALPILHKAAIDRLQHFKSLNAPQCIVDNQQKIVNSLNKGKSPSVAALYAQIKKIDAAKCAISSK